MGYMIGYDNIVTILLIFIGLIIVLYAQFKINSTYAKYKKIKSVKGLTGCEVARVILDKNGLEDIYVVETSGTLTDHYDPTRKVIKLSHDIFNGDSISSISVAAHECGHAIQDKENYSFMRIRSMLVPIVNFISYSGYFVMIISIFIGMSEYLLVGIFMLLATLLFQLITLPVEFDASKRALNELLNLNLCDENEIDRSKDVLSAAAFTYVASVISSILNILRLILIFNDRNDR